jgi:gamma-glutamylcyclotransferase (GGCT)/AIG2-like uncharacterized protein YtfP
MRRLKLAQNQADETCYFYLRHPVARPAAGGRNARRPLLGPAQIAGRLIDVGLYPGLLQGDGQVTGEVYEVDDAHLARLDGVEGVVPGDRAESHYWREVVTVLSGPLQGQQVQTYVYNLPVDGCTPLRTATTAATSAKSAEVLIFRIFSPDQSHPTDAGGIRRSAALGSPTQSRHVAWFRPTRPAASATGLG